VYLSIFILVINEFDEPNLFYKFFASSWLTTEINKKVCQNIREILNTRHMLPT